MVAHVVVESGVLWYPFVALLVPALLIAGLTRYDAVRHARRRSGLPASPAPAETAARALAQP